MHRCRDGREQRSTVLEVLGSWWGRGVEGHVSERSQKEQEGKRQVCFPGEGLWRAEPQEAAERRLREPGFVVAGAHANSGLPCGQAGYKAKSTDPIRSPRASVRSSCQEGHRARFLAA